jgi:hypothetical protein
MMVLRAEIRVPELRSFVTASILPLRQTQGKNDSKDYTRLFGRFAFFGLPFAGWWTVAEGFLVALELVEGASRFAGFG